MLKTPARSYHRRGAAMVEAAFSMGLLLMILFGILEYGRYVMVRQVMSNAAREGARYAVVSTTDNVSDTNVRDRVQGYMAGLHTQLDAFDKNTNILLRKVNPANGTDLGNWKNAAFGETIEVVVTGDFKPVVPLLMGNTRMPIRVNSVMRSEAN